MNCVAALRFFGLAILAWFALAASDLVFYVAMLYVFCGSLNEFPPGRCICFMLYRKNGDDLVVKG